MHTLLIYKELNILKLKRIRIILIRRFLIKEIKLNY